MDSNIDFNSLTAEQVIQLIQHSLSGDNEKIKQSTKMLKVYTKHKGSIRTLSFILINATQLAHRQMAAVLLKRNLVNLYSTLNTAEQAEFRQILLSQYIKEPSLLVQKGIATLISILLPVVEIKNWGELQQLLDQAIKSAPNSAATFVLLNSILYHFKAPKQLYSYLLNALHNPTLAEQAIKCVISVVQSQDVEPSFAVQFIRIWQQNSWCQEISTVAIEVLTVMVERKLKLADEVTIWVCERIIGNKKLSNRLRTAGCDYLFSLADYCPKQLASRDALLKKVVQTVCLTCSEPYHHREDDDGEVGQFVQEIALWLIQTLAITVKPKKIYPVLFEAAVALINSDDVNKMNTGFLVLGAICEGCAQKIKKNLQNPIMNVLIPKGLNHSAPQVRGAAINALCYFSEHLLPDIFEYHAVVVPSMMKYVGDLSPKVVSKALIAIDIFFDGMEQEDILLYLDVVIPKLIEVIAAPQATPLMKAAAVSAIGSAVQVSEQKFQHYLAQIIPACKYLLEMPPSPQNNTVRSENLSVLGKIANVFCKPEYPNHAAFYQSYIMGTMETVYGFLLNEQDPQIRESAFAFFYLIANAIGSKFEIVFDNLIPLVIASCQPKEAPQKNKNISLDSDSEDEEEAAGNVITQKATEHDQKAAAIHALGELARACSLKFAPYFETAHKLLDQHYQHFYENIRIQVAHCYTNLTIGLVKSQNGGVLPPIVKGLPCQNRYPTILQEHFRCTLIPRLLFLMTEDDDKKVKGAAVQSIDDLVKQLGPAFIDRNLPALTEAIMRLLESQVQEDLSDEQQEDEGQALDEQTEVHTFEAICDLIPTLAENLLSGFQPNLAQLHPYLLKYLEEREEINDNIQMTGCLSQCFKWVPGYTASHAQELFRSLAALVPLQDTEVNRNVSYCLAQMFQKCAYAMSPYLQDGLILLKQIFEHRSSEQACKDNAVGAICRIIYTINPPMPHQIFIDNLIKMMPFQGDEQEQSSALKALIFLYQANTAVILPHREAIVRILQNDLSHVEKYLLKQPLISDLKTFLSRLLS